MALKWNDTLAMIVQDHLSRLLKDDERRGDNDRLIAIKANALPVYLDMSGTICITTKGEVLLFEPESGQITIINDEKWKTIAAVSTAKRYPDLQEIIPARPSLAEECPDRLARVSKIPHDEACEAFGHAVSSSQNEFHFPIREHCERVPVQG